MQIRRVTFSTFVPLLIAVLAGCERAPVATPATQHAGEPQTSSARIAAANVPTTGPVERAPSVVLVDQKPITFPPAVMRLRTRDGQVTATLMSDDPKTAIDDNYQGNSFYLEMPLEIADAKDLSNYVYRYVAPSNERTDSPNGIFLDGNRIQLQPSMIQVKFEGDESGMIVMLSGEFLQIETRDDTLSPRVVKVNCKLDAQLKQK